MKTGLLWYDDDPRKTLEMKIEQAAARYHEKYGRVPNACYVSPSTTSTVMVKQGIRLIPARSIRPNYFWIGVDDKP